MGRDAMEMPQGTGTEMGVEQELKPLFAALADRLRHARSKHDWPTTVTDLRAKTSALYAIYGEWEELEQAIIRKEGRAREKDEALDVMAVAARYWLGDHLPQGGEKWGKLDDEELDVIASCVRYWLGDYLPEGDK